MNESSPPLNAFTPIYASQLGFYDYEPLGAATAMAVPMRTASRIPRGAFHKSRN